MKVYEYPSREIWDQILARPVISLENLESIVKPVLSAVKEGGDKAIFELTAKFDKVTLNTLLVSESEFEEAKTSMDDTLKNAIQVAYSNIEKFHTVQKEEVTLVETMPGVRCWRKSIAIQKVGLYIPGGTAPLFSTVLMLGIPAKIAGCEELVLCTPPAKDGKIHPAILYTAHLLGITKVYKVGGSI